MKKLICVLLALTLVLGLAACGKNKTENTTGAAMDTPGSALEILENTWALYAENETFSTVGGDAEALVMDAPGAYSLSDEGLNTILLVPQEQTANITEAASLMHALMSNYFTCGAFRVTDPQAFAKAMREGIAANRWLCATPETLLVAQVGSEYVVAAFGLYDNIEVFQTRLTQAYPGTQVLYSEAITG